MTGVGRLKRFVIRVTFLVAICVTACIWTLTGTSNLVLLYDGWYVVTNPVVAISALLTLAYCLNAIARATASASRFVLRNDESFTVQKQNRMVIDLISGCDGAELLPMLTSRRISLGAAAVELLKIYKSECPDAFIAARNVQCLSAVSAKCSKAAFVALVDGDAPIGSKKLAFGMLMRESNGGLLKLAEGDPSLLFKFLLINTYIEDTKWAQDVMCGLCRRSYEYPHVLFLRRALRIKAILDGGKYLGQVSRERIWDTNPVTANELVHGAIAVELLLHSNQADIGHKSVLDTIKVGIRHGPIELLAAVMDAVFNHIDSAACRVLFDQCVVDADYGERWTLFVSLMAFRVRMYDYVLQHIHVVIDSGITWIQDVAQLLRAAAQREVAFNNHGRVPNAMPAVNMAEVAISAMLKNCGWRAYCDRVSVVLNRAFLASAHACHRRSYEVLQKMLNIGSYHDVGE